MATEGVTTRQEEALAGETQQDYSGVDEFVFGAPARARTPHHLVAPRIRRPRLPGRDHSGAAAPTSFEAAPAEGAPLGPPPQPARISLRSAGIVALAAILVAGVAGWWFVQARQPDPTTLSVSFPRKGATVSRVSATLDWRSDYAPINLELYGKFDGLLTLRTLSLKKDRARLRAILDISTFVVNEHPITDSQSSRGWIEIRTDGSTARGGKIFFPGLGKQLFALGWTGLTPDLDGRPVVPGDSWTDTFKARIGTDRLEGQTRSELLRYENVGDVSAAVVHGTKDLRLKGGPPLPGTGSVKIDQTAWLDPESGKVLRMTATVEVTYRPRERFGGGRRILIEGVETYRLDAI